MHKKLLIDAKVSLAVDSNDHIFMTDTDTVNFEVEGNHSMHVTHK